MTNSSIKIKAALVGVAAVSALVLTGCSGSGSQTGSNASGSAAPSASAGAYPVSVATKFGEVTIEKKPTRVVALGWGDAETALELGVQPVGASDWLGFGGDGVGPWDSGKYTTKPTIIGTLQPNYEQIAALHPDLILNVRSSGDAAEYQKLASIAPTIDVPKGGENYLTTTEQETTMIAAALGEETAGQALLAKVSAAFTAAAAAHPDWKGKTVTVATRTSQGWGAYTNGDVRVKFLQKLGFTLSPTIAKMEPNSSGFSVSISDEQLGLLNADLIVAFPIFVPSTQLTGDAQWKAVPAVKAGRDLVVDSTLSNAYSAGTPGAELYALQKLVPMIEKTPVGK